MNTPHPTEFSGLRLHAMPATAEGPPAALRQTAGLPALRLGSEKRLRPATPDVGELRAIADRVADLSYFGTMLVAALSLVRMAE